MALLNMSKKDAERWLALEFITAAAVRTIYEFREQNALLGPSTYGVLIITYSVLAVVALWDETADVAAIIGGLILLAIMLRPTSPKGAVSSLVGKDVGASLAGFSDRVGANAPTHAGGVTSSGAGGPAKGSGPGASGGGGGGLPIIPEIPGGFPQGPVTGLPFSPISTGSTANRTLDLLSGNVNV